MCEYIKILISWWAIRLKYCMGASSRRVWWKVIHKLEVTSINQRVYFTVNKIYHGCECDAVEWKQNYSFHKVIVVLLTYIVCVLSILHMADCHFHVHILISVAHSPIQQFLWYTSHSNAMCNNRNKKMGDENKNCKMNEWRMHVIFDACYGLSNLASSFLLFARLFCHLHLCALDVIVSHLFFILNDILHHFSTDSFLAQRKLTQITFKQMIVEFITRNYIFLWLALKHFTPL